MCADLCIDCGGGGAGLALALPFLHGAGVGVRGSSSPTLITRGVHICSAMNGDANGSAIRGMNCGLELYAICTTG